LSLKSIIGNFIYKFTYVYKYRIFRDTRILLTWYDYMNYREIYLKERHFYYGIFILKENSVL